MKSTIGQNIAELRKNLDMTQAELAEKMNVSIQAVSKWENDISYPDIERIGQLASILNTCVERIISGNDFFSLTELKNSDNLAKRLLIISVNVIAEHPFDIKLRIPAELILKAQSDGTLNTLLGDDFGEQIPDAAFEMMRNGVVGPIADVKTENTTVRLEVVEYDN